jgi:hypothetical protein
LEKKFLFPAPLIVEIRLTIILFDQWQELLVDFVIFKGACQEQPTVLALHSKASFVERTLGIKNIILWRPADPKVLTPISGIQNFGAMG